MMKLKRMRWMGYVARMGKKYIQSFGEDTEGR
jgi:hypothetical protein